ncbi:alpha/beta hydrolase [soil metagenome]
MNLLAIGLIASTLTGWSDITIQPSKGDQTLSSWQRNLVTLDRPSPRTLDTLNRYDQDKRFGRDPEGALSKLELFARRRPDSELVYGLAELSWIEGQRLDRRRKPEAIDRYLDAVAYSYDFLFDPDLAEGRHPADPRYRLAIDFYNAGLDRLIRAAQAKGGIQPGDTIVLEIHGKQHEIRVQLPASPWKPEDVDELIIASDYEVSGLATRTHRYGLGVPLIAVRRADQHQDGSGQFYSSQTAFPLTALLRPYSKLGEVPESGPAPRAVTLDLVDSVKYQSYQDLVLESDLSVPLAYMFSMTDLKRVGLTGMLRPDRTAERSGLMLLRPYEPDKIPVVMVHGLMSSPLAWIPMLNELQRDPAIISQYQFLLYLYPTGMAVPLAATGLREDLYLLQQQYDPEGTNPAFNRMVLLGHSMGGLLSHSVAVKSDDHLWNLMSFRRFDDLIGPQDVLEELRRHLFFNAVPFVRRVVFLGTPHHGSEIGRSVIGRIGSGLISESDEVSRLLDRLVKDNPDAFDRKQFRRMPTSIDNLAADSPVLLALLKMTPSKDVTFHSIIGNKSPSPRDRATDGVVPYSSAHFPGAESELVVLSDHSVQKTQESIREVHRILLEHLRLGSGG